VNEQTEVALLLAGPVFLAMLGLAPWVIELLYSSKFAEAAVVLRWQIMGDILKVVSFPLGFVILAAGNGRTFMLTETLSIVVYAILVWIGLPYLGLQATGVGFLIMYIVLLPLVYWLARYRTGFRWARYVFAKGAALMMVGSLVAIVAAKNRWAGAALGVVAAGIFGLYALERLAHVTVSSGLLMRLAITYRKLILKFGVRNE
ncbi:MAG: O-antigen translocase, partial [Glaciimonas sp.]|nr:O-antigen translocase [Glaciimonas sp.]